MKRGREIFHLGDVLSVTTGRQVSPRDDGEVEVITFMCRGEIPQEKLDVARQLCREHIIKQDPRLDEEKMERYVRKLDKNLDAVPNPRIKSMVRADWLNKQVTRFGSVIAIAPIPEEDLAPLRGAESLGDNK